MEVAWIGIILFSGYIAESVFPRLRLPVVSGMILAGFVLGPGVSGVITGDFLESLGPLMDICLAVIGFLIGGSLHWKRIRKLENIISGILFSQFFATLILTTAAVFGGLVLLFPDIGYHGSAGLAILLGLVSSATAPAAVLAVVHEKKAHGPLTTTLLSIVAADDAIALIVYSLLLPVALVLLGQEGGEFSLSGVGMEIFLSVATGLLIGVLLMKFLKKGRGSSPLPVFGAIFISYGLDGFIHMNGLLSAMVSGAVVANMGHTDDLFENISANYEKIIFALFFVVSGAHLRVEPLVLYWQMTLVYVLFRFAGKVTGSWLGASFVQASPAIRKYTGIALVPQAGVAIGLMLLITGNLESERYARMITSIVLASVAVNELVGPVLTGYALKKAGET